MDTEQDQIVAAKQLLTKMLVDDRLPEVINIVTDVFTNAADHFMNHKTGRYNADEWSRLMRHARVLRAI